jgi:ABC-2 type transport system permease protein
MPQAQAEAPPVKDSAARGHWKRLLICAAIVAGGGLLAAGLNALYWNRLSGSSRTTAMAITNTLWAGAAVFLILTAIGKVWVVLRKELVGYFSSPLAYVLAALFSAVLLLFHWPRLGEGPKHLLPNMFGFSSFLMIFLVPILTMRLLAQERETGAMEVLVTDPVTDWDIVLGKYLAAVVTLCGMLLPLGVYVAGYSLVGWGSQAPDVSWYRFWAWIPRSMDWGPVFSGLLGTVLIGAVFVAVGLFASSLTSSQPISALIGFTAILVLCVFAVVSRFFDTGKATELVESFSLFARQSMLIEGRLDTRPLFLFLSTTALMLYLTVRVVESRKWR